MENMRPRIKNTRFDLSVLLRLSIFAEYTRQPIMQNLSDNRTRHATRLTTKKTHQ